MTSIQFFNKQTWQAYKNHRPFCYHCLDVYTNRNFGFIKRKKLQLISYKLGALTSRYSQALRKGLTTLDHIIRNLTLHFYFRGLNLWRSNQTTATTIFAPKRSFHLPKISWLQCCCLFELHLRSIFFQFFIIFKLLFQYCIA